MNQAVGGQMNLAVGEQQVHRWTGQGELGSSCAGEWAAGGQVNCVDDGQVNRTAGRQVNWAAGGQVKVDVTDNM
jgi:hypothetical protein